MSTFGVVIIIRCDCMYHPSHQLYAVVFYVDIKKLHAGCYNLICHYHKATDYVAPLPNYVVMSRGISLFKAHALHYCVWIMYAIDPLYSVYIMWLYQIRPSIWIQLWRTYFVICYVFWWIKLYRARYVWCSHTGHIALTLYLTYCPCASYTRAICTLYRLIRSHFCSHTSVKNVYIFLHSYVTFVISIDWWTPYMSVHWYFFSLGI